MRRTARVRASLAVALVSAAFLVPVGAGRSAGAAPTPPPTPVPPNGSPSPFPTILVTPTPSVVPPEVSSRAAVLEDLDTGQTLYAKASRARVPAASLMKIMTALVVLAKAGPDETVVVSDLAASQPGSVLGLRPGERISVRNLLYALLLQSSNDAAVALAEHVGGSVEGFVGLMNRRARDMGMTDSTFTSPSGLDDSGRTSARDLAPLTRAAFLDPLFARIVRTKFHTVPAPSGPARHIQNRNILLWLYPGAIGVKTGFTSQAGHCLVAAAERDGERLLAVGLGSPGPDAGGVFDDGASLLNYGFAAFQERDLIHAGDAVGPLEVQGQAVPAVAASTFTWLVRSDQLDDVSVEVRVEAGLTLPVEPGRRVGSVVLLVAGDRVGQVDVVAVPAPAPSPAPPPVPAPTPPGGPEDPVARFLLLLGALYRAIVGAFL